MVHSITTLILDLTTEQTINYQKKREGRKSNPRSSTEERKLGSI